MTRREHRVRALASFIWAEDLARRPVRFGSLPRRYVGVRLPADWAADRLHEWHLQNVLTRDYADEMDERGDRLVEYRLTEGGRRTLTGYLGDTDTDGSRKICSSSWRRQLL